MTSTASSSISARTSHSRPALPEDVLVEVLAGADAEEEPAGHQGCGGRRRLGDDRRVDPDRRAGDAGAELEPLGRLRRSRPSTPHTNGLLPCRSIHGWKWSEISANSKPRSSARAAWRTRSSGGCSSLERA